MPDRKYHDAYWTELPACRKELEAAIKENDLLRAELQTALTFTNTDYVLQGHFLRVMLNHFTPPATTTEKETP